MFKKKILVTVLALFVFLCSNAQSNSIKQITIENGLTDNFLTSVTQDSYGFIWITTRHGINRYDGRNIKTFAPNDDIDFSSINLECSVTDKLGRILMAGHNGVIIRYNYEYDRFENLSINDIYGVDYVAINRFFASKKGQLYALTSNGLYLFDYSKDCFVNTLSVFKNMKSLNVKDIYIDTYNRFWIAASSGLFIYDVNGKLTKHFPMSSNSVAEFYCLEAVNDSLLFIGTATNGLWCVDLQAYPTVAKPYRMDSPFCEVSSLLSDSKNVYIGTHSLGIWSASIHSSSFKKESFIPINKNHKATNDLLKDKQGNLYLATQGTGLICYEANKYSGVTHSSEFGFPKTIISSIVEDSHNNFWIGSDGDGIYKLTSNKSISHISLANGLSSNGILSLAYDTKNKAIWVATWGGGISKIDEQTANVQTWTSYNSTLPLNNSKSVCVSSNGVLWNGTHGAGLCYYESKSNKWNTIQNKFLSEHPYLNLWINQVYESKDGSLWIVTVKNIWKYQDNTFHLVLGDTSSKPSHFPLYTNAITSNQYNEIFAATTSGIYQITSDGTKSKLLEFIPKQEYLSIAFDKNNILWCVTANAILEVHLSTKRFKNLILPHNYDKGAMFMARSIFCGQNGTMYVGVIDGFLQFNPNIHNEKNSVESLKFADLYISTEKVKAGSIILPKQLAFIKTLTLSYNETNITLGVDFVCNSETKGIYRLQGIDKSWNTLSNNNQIQYSQIPPGSYTLEVKVWSGSSSENAKMISLKIFVTPPWWKTWWFIMILNIIIVVLILLYIKHRLRNIIKQNQKLENLVRERTFDLQTAYEEINSQNKLLNEKQFVIEIKNDELSRTINTKDMLLSIIAHDLKNPMQAIVLTLDILKNKPDSYDANKKQKMLNDLFESSLLLQQEMVNLLEWAQNQQRILQFSPQNTDIQVIISDTISFLKQLSDSKTIELRFSNKKNVSVRVDVHMITIAIRNLLSNAIKFTKRGGVVFIDTETNGTDLKIIVRDTGVGMNQEQIQNLFKQDVFESTWGTENEKGTGFGMKICQEFISRHNGKIEVKSTVGEGTCFEITLPSCVLSTETENCIIENTETVEETTIHIDTSILEGNTILLIDDNPVILKYLREIIGQYATIIDAENGEIGLKIAQEQQPDIIISDVDMPLKNGIELCKEIVSSPATAHIPIILLTAKSDIQNKLEGLLSGAVDYLTKPFNEVELLIKLNNTLTVRRNQQKNVLQATLIEDREVEKIHPFLAKIMEIIEQNYTNPEYGIDNLTDALSMSKATLSRKLSSIIDKTPLELINEYRLHKSKQMLLETEMNISEIAYEVGFNDPRYFSRKFKEYFDLTPSQIRE